MKKLILTMAAIAIVGCSPPTTTIQQACAYYDDNSCDQSRDIIQNKPFPWVGWYCSNVKSACEDYKIKQERLTLITNQLNTDNALKIIVQQSLTFGVNCFQYPNNAYCLAIDMRSKQLSEVKISSSQYQQIMYNINKNNVQAQVNQDALEILKAAESGKKF